MNKRYEKIVTRGNRKTKLRFHFYNDMGLNIIQMIEIEILVSEYLKKYPLLEIPMICDYYSMDHTGKADNYSYFHDNEGVKYEKRKDLARYFWNSKKIGINHIKMRRTKFDDENHVEKVNKLVKVRERIAKVGIKNKFSDVILIKKLEKKRFLKRVMLHEIGHAVAFQYGVNNDDKIKKIFEQFEKDFKDIDEFIAECFMTSELTDAIPLANQVKQRINHLVELKE